MTGLVGDLIIRAANCELTLLQLGQQVGREMADVLQSHM